MLPTQHGALPTTLVYMPPASQLRCVPSSLYRVYRPDHPTVTFFKQPICTFSSAGEEKRPLHKGKCLFAPQEITLFPEETGQKGRRNPLQKALSHKDGQNPLTPQ